MTSLEPGKLLRQRWEALTTERSSWDSHWRELAEHFSPRRGRFQQSDVNVGSKKNDKILNGRPMRAVKVLSAGMQSGITSPARPWFRIVTPDPDLNEFGAVREWLHVCEERIRDVFNRSNFYLQQHRLYGDISVFGTGVAYVEEDAQDTIRLYDVPPGSHCLAVSERCAVNVIFHELTFTVANLVRKFGEKKVSQRVREAYQRGHLEQRVQVVHMVEPNEDFTLGKLDRFGKLWRSVWFEADADENQPFLGEGGYHDFPYLAVRWDATGEDVYGRGPGMDALADAKELQEWTRRTKNLGEKASDPPMVGPPSLTNRRASTLPGELTIVAEMNAGGMFRPAFEVRADQIMAARQNALDCEQRLQEAFYADLWLQMQQSDDVTKTATEVVSRKEEAMIQLGPVLDRLNDEDLDPAIDRTFAVALRRGLLPPPPEELRGMPLRVEYTSIMAEAQKLLGTSSLQRLAGFAGNLAAAKAEVLDKFDHDAALEEYARMLGTNPRLIVAQAKVDELRKQRAQAAQQERQLEQAGQLAAGAKVMSQADLQGDSALSRLVGNLGGVAAGTVLGGA